MRRAVVELLAPGLPEGESLQQRLAHEDVECHVESLFDLRRIIPTYVDSQSLDEYRSCARIGTVEEPLVQLRVLLIVGDQAR